MDIKDLNPDIIERAKACKSSEELVALATEQGQELTDEQLEVIAGGAWYDCDGHEGNGAARRRRLVLPITAC